MAATPSTHLSAFVSTTTKLTLLMQAYLLAFTSIHAAQSSCTPNGKTRPGQISSCCTMDCPPCCRHPMTPPAQAGSSISRCSGGGKLSSGNVLFP